MKPFLLKLALFCLPFAAAFVPPLAILLRGGELVSVDRVIEAQQQPRPLLFGLAYSNPDKSYKFRSVERRKPEVIALGSSRVMQVRAHFFREPDTFYNAGGAVGAVWDLRQFVELLDRDTSVRVLIVGLDPWFFNPHWSDDGELGPGPFRSDDPRLNILQRRWWKVYRDLFVGKIDLRRLFLTRHYDIGVSAVLEANGFRNDGSYFYGDVITHPATATHWDPGFRDTLARIADGNRRFQWGDDVSPEAVAEVGRFLDACRRRGLQLVAVLPPFAPTVYRRMAGSGHFGYLNEIAPALRPAFERAGYPLLDFNDPGTLGASDAEFIDGFHGSERTYARILLRAAEQLPALARTIDRAELGRRLAHAGRFTVAPAVRREALPLP